MFFEEISPPVIESVRPLAEGAGGGIIKENTTQKLISKKYLKNNGPINPRTCWRSNIAIRSK